MAQFGYATLTVASENGVAGAEVCVIEQSSAFVTAAFFDNTRTPFVPSALRYRIDDVASNSNIQPWLGIAPATVCQVTINPAQNVIISDTRQSEAHQVLFQVTDGLGDVVNVHVIYEVLRVAGLG